MQPGEILHESETVIRKSCEQCSVLKTDRFCCGLLFWKAQEYQRLVEVKASTSALAALKISGSCQVVMCLDLASQQCGQLLDKKTAIRLSGLIKRIYLSSLQALESMLGLSSHQTLKEIAVQYGCTEASSLAQEILNRYESSQKAKSCDPVDVGAPLFQSAALCAACRKLKVKVDWTKLRDVASVKKSTFDRLVSDLEKIAQDVIGDKKSPNRKRAKTFYEELENAVLEEEAVPVKRAVEEDQGDPKANFQLWKEKILAQAAKQKS